MTLRSPAFTIVAAVAAFALVACGTGTEKAASAVAADVETHPARGTSAIESVFDQAASEYQVPVQILKAIAYVETRVQPTEAKPSLTHGYGVMNLVDRSDWPALQKGATLTGADKGRVILTEEANIRAAAAFLRQLADKTFAEYGDLNPTDPADWWQAVSLYAGLDSATQGSAYAAEIFHTIDRGFEVTRKDGTVAMPGTHYDWERHAPVAQRRDAVKEYPGAYQWVASPNYSTSSSRTYQYIVIHTMQGSYAGSISWFQNPSSQVSAHYCVRSSDGQITQMVEHAKVAWHAQCYNSKSIGIEHEGYVSAPSTWYTTNMYRESAKLTRWIADRHGIAKNRTHIIGHAEVSPGCNTGGHTDPGSGWNWTTYMGLVLGSTPTGSTGVLRGVIYTGGNTANRVSGATVTVSGHTVTTGTTGEYSFTLAPGTYTATVTKSGYTSATVTKMVTAGATIWGSMQINPSSTKGTLTGIIYEGGSASNRVAGATVTVNGQSKTTGTDGLYSFQLNPGTYTVSVTRSGYSTNSVQRAVTASSTVWGSMEINPVSNPGTLTGVIYQNGNTSDRVQGATVTVKGTSNTVTTAANGVYSFNLAPGTYTVTASKSGYQNASVTRTVSSGATIWGSMELKTGTPAGDSTPPSVGITFPGDGASMELAVITLTGEASDDKGAIDQVTLSINGGTPAKVNVTDGAFEQQIKLYPGENTIEVSATDAAGNTSVDTVKATFRAGISGFLHVADDDASRVPDATVRLLDVATGNEVVSATSGQDGSFELDVTEVGKDYLLTVKAPGFLTHTETLTVPDDERMHLELPMQPGEDPLPSEVKIDFVDPQDGATLTVDHVAVYGTVNGFQATSVKVNGVDAELLSDGGFSATVPLQLGANTIEASAVGINGESVTGSMTITRVAPDDGSGGGDDGGKDTRVHGGCTAIPGLELFALLGLIPMLRRRRS